MGYLARVLTDVRDPMAGFIFGNVHAATAFIGCNGVHPESGVADRDRLRYRVGVVGRGRCRHRDDGDRRDHTDGALDSAHV